MVDFLPHKTMNDVMEELKKHPMFVNVTRHNLRYQMTKFQGNATVDEETDGDLRAVTPSPPPPTQNKGGTRKGNTKATRLALEKGRKEALVWAAKEMIAKKEQLVRRKSLPNGTLDMVVNQANKKFDLKGTKYTLNVDTVHSCYKKCKPDGYQKSPMADVVGYEYSTLQVQVLVYRVVVLLE
jgi:hypothetical protein